MASSNNNSPSLPGIPNSIRLMFVFLSLMLFTGVFLFRNYRHLEQVQREYIKQEEKVVTRMTYLERIGRNDFLNYTNLLQHNNSMTSIQDSVFRNEFDSLTKVNTAYIGSFWTLINSGQQTTDLDSLNAHRKMYLAAIKNYNNVTGANNSLPITDLTKAFNVYRDFHQDLMNKQYADINTLLRRSHETLINEIATIIILLLCCMTMAVLLTWYSFRISRKSKESVSQ